MPRRARLQIPGYPMHVVQRGHGGRDVFDNDADRTVFLGLVVEQARRWDCLVHAYVLMSNHVHMLLTAEEPGGLSQFMKRVHQTYAQYINRKYERIGSLWQGRFHSSLVDTDAYLLVCQRYIELNPVRAGMVSHPAMHPWSSFGFNALGSPSFVSPHATYAGLGSDPGSRQKAYRRLFETQPLTEAMEARIREAARGCLPLGSDDFVARLAAQTGRRLGRLPPGPRKASPTLRGQLVLMP